jgi:hypothetical protein
VIIWVVAAVIGLVALMRLMASSDDPAAGETVRVDRAPGVAPRAGPAKAARAGRLT